MLQAPLKPASYSLRERRRSDPNTFEEVGEGQTVDQMADLFDDDDDDDLGEEKGRNKSRRELPAGAVATLKAWLLSPEHFSHPYPTPQDQAMLMQKTGIDKKQLKNWFTNARRRIWKPMLKKQIEQGALPPGGAQVMPGGLLIPLVGATAQPSTTASLDNPHSIQAMRVHYQQVVQDQQQQQQQQAVPLDSYGNPIYASAANEQTGQFYATEAPSMMQMSSISSIGTMPQLSSSTQLSKTDSHAVLMELFARDQDLVRQATESARLKAEAKQQQQQQQHQNQTGAQLPQVPSQHPMKPPGASGLHNVPTMNSWPHFSSITSLNNLGTIPGVKSITSLSGVDLASKGDVNKMGNLAQVKSMESMGKNDSYAFLEVFFGDRSSSANLSAMVAGGSVKGMKSEEDNEIGLSLEDESPSQPMKKDFQIGVSMAPQPSSLTSMVQENSGNMQSGTLKRAYDDALAARGLISVSRSSERLTDLVLPDKIQRTLSQEFMNKEPVHQYGHFSFKTDPSMDSQLQQQTSSSQQQTSSSSVQYPGQQPKEPQSVVAFLGQSEADGHVQVPTATKCALCSQINVDTQLRPCGHMFHEKCLKPSLQSPMGPPKCPVDDIPMLSAVLAVPTDEVNQSQSSWNHHSLSMPAQN